MEYVMHKCEKFCLKDAEHKIFTLDKKVSVVDKLNGNGKLPALKQMILDEIKKPYAMTKLMQSPEYAQISAALKVDLLESMKEGCEEFECGDCDRLSIFYKNGFPTENGIRCSHCGVENNLS